MKFRDPNYVYDPQELMAAAHDLNSTIAGINFSNVTVTGPGLMPVGFSRRYALTFGGYPVR